MRTGGKRDLLGRGFTSAPGCAAGAFLAARGPSTAEEFAFSEARIQESADARLQALAQLAIGNVCAQTLELVTI